MDALRQKYKRGQIDKKTYQEKLTELTIFHLEAINYKYVGKIAEGVHGVVVEMKSPETVLNVAVKIVIDDFELESGLMSWPKLIHENVLPLLTWRVIWQANSKAFITLKYEKTLQSKLSSFRCDFNGFEKGVNFTRDITNAIKYLHHQGLCHLNLTHDCIFVEYNNKARLGGFGYLTSKDTNNLKFGTTALFRPPEVYPGTNRKVDGQKFDIWSLGVLAVETFTGEYLSKEMSKWQAQPETWYMQLYELLYEVLEKEMFNELVKKHIPNWKVDDEKLDQLLNFIKSCLIFNLEDRPSADDLLKLKFFGGNVEKYCPKEPPDIWAEMVCSMDLVMNASEKRNLNMSDSDFDISDNENNYDEKPLDVGLEIRDATVKRDTDFCVENNSVNISAFDCEKDVNNSKMEENEKCIISDVISDGTKIKDDKYENDGFDKIIESKVEENFILQDGGQRNILDFKHLHDDIKNQTNETKTEANANIDLNMSLSDKGVKEANVGFNEINTDVNIKEKSNDIERKTEKIEIKENLNADMNMPKRDKDVKEKNDKVDKKDKVINVKEESNMKRIQVKKVGYKGYVIRKNNTLNLDRHVRKDKSVFDKENKKINMENKSNALKMMIEEIDIKMKMADKINVPGVDNEITNKVKNKDEKAIEEIKVKEKMNEIDIKEKKIEFKNVNKNQYIKEKTNDAKKKCHKSKINENTSDNVNIPNNDGGVKDEKIKENDIGDMMKNTDVKEEKGKENDKGNMMKVSDVKEERINEIDIGDMMKNTELKDEKVKENDIGGTIKDSDGKEEKVKENDKGNMMKVSDVKEEKIKENDIGDMVKDNHVKAEKIKEKDKGNMIRDITVKKEKIKENDICDIIKVSDLKEEKVKESSIGDMMKDSDVKKYETKFDKKNDDLNVKDKINDMKKQDEKTELEGNYLDDRNISEIDEKEKYEVIMDKNFESLSDVDLNEKNKTDVGNNNIEAVEPVQCKLNDALVSISNFDTPESFTDNFETNKRKKRLKRRRKKVKPEKLMSTSNTDSEAKPERINFHTKKTKKNRSNKNLLKENETVSNSNDNYIEHNLEDLQQRSRLSLNKAQSENKYLEMHKYQNSCKSFTQKQSVYTYFKMNQECSLNICEKRDDTIGKQKLSRKTYAPKNMIEMVEKSPATSSSRDHKSVRKTYSSEIVKQKIIKSPATSSSENRRSIRNTYLPKNVRTIQDDENEELEPGEVPLFKKDYDKILDKQGPEYSVAFLSGIFTNDDDEDLEEGEVDPNNPDSSYDSKPTRIRRRFKHLRSWWKRQKKNMTNCFTACFCTSGVN